MAEAERQRLDAGTSLRASPSWQERPGAGLLDAWGVQPGWESSRGRGIRPAPSIEVLVGFYPTDKAHGRHTLAFHPREIVPRHHACRAAPSLYHQKSLACGQLRPAARINAYFEVEWHADPDQSR